jgi:hypothetical protein
MRMAAAIGLEVAAGSAGMIVLLVGLGKGFLSGPACRRSEFELRL